jgi:glycosyltransferase involved in cell wall biosynthesis
VLELVGPRMRLLHIADRLTDRGGCYTHMLAVLRELASRHQVTLAVGRRERSRAPCPVVVWPGLDAREDTPVAGLDGPAAPPRHWDIVHLHNVVNPAVLNWAAAAGPSVVTVQDHRFFCPGRGKWHRDGAPCRDRFDAATCAACFDEPAYFGQLLALTRARLDALRGLTVVVLSEYMRGELVQAGLDAHRVRVIPPFVEGLDADAQPSGLPCVAVIGRLVEAKGVRDAVEAWRRSGVELPLVFAGTGPLRAELEREGFEVLGWLDRGQLSALYRRSRAVLMPSRWQEPFGIVGPEALSLGAPVVAWDSGGVTEWYRGEHVAWGDVDGLARALRATVERRAQAAPGLERETLMERLEELYRSLRLKRG